MARICLYCARFPFEPFGVAPLGVGYIASYLSHKGIVGEEDIRIVDSLEEAIEFRPDILGISSVSQVLGNARQFARKCKEVTECLTVLGGYHGTCIPQGLPEEFDIGVLGEGEVTFAEIVQKFIGDQLSQQTLHEIQGVCYRKNGRIVQTQPRELIADIDELPWPYRHKRYSSEEPLFTSRGCPFRCTFCASHSFWGDRCRFRSTQSVVEEITHLVEAYEPKEIAILDDLWIAKKKRFREIVEKLVERGIPQKVTFTGFCRSNIVNEEDILLFKKLNYRFVRFGAETGSERLLRHIKGNSISVFDHQRVIDLCFKHGLACGASFMFGVPGETMEDLELTIDFLRKNRGKCHISGFYLCNPIPGTPMWKELIENGKITENLEFERLQLDFLKPNFSWDDILYFNEENIPLKEFQEIVEDIKHEFISQPNKTKGCKKMLKDNKSEECHYTKLEFGCGEKRPKHGFVGVDVRKFEHIRYVCNAWEIEKFIPKGTVTEIYSRHFFEHLTFIQADLTLKAWKRTLAPFGMLQIIVPDMEYHIKQFLNPNHLDSSDANPKWTVLEHALAGFWGWQREGETDTWDIHKSGYDFRCLKMKLLEHGLSDIRRIEDNPWNLNVICIRRPCISMEKEAEQRYYANPAISEAKNRERKKISEKSAGPMVSVIVPTYNRPDMLIETLNSILNQTYQNFEIIVVNDAGVDIKNIVSSLNQKNNIACIRHSRNKGLAAARNTGIKVARGKYIAYLDDDDVSYPDHLETLVNFLENSDYKVAYTDTYRAHQVKENGEYVVKKRDIPYSYDFNYDQILANNFVPVLCLMHEKSCLNESGFFDESLTSHEDWDLWIRMSRKFQFAHIKKVTSEFSWRIDATTMTSQNKADFLRTSEIIYEKYKEYTKDKPHVLAAQKKTLQNLKEEIYKSTSHSLASIIIPVFNKVEYTMQCLEALASNTSYEPYEVIIVDNGSTDGTKDFLKKCLGGDVKIITNEKNLGFAVACNQGARAAAEGKYLVFLNNDTVPMRGWLSELVKTIECIKDVGVVGNKLLYPDETVQHAGVAFTKDRKVYHIYRGVHSNHPAVNRIREFQVVTGACMLVRKELFFEVGGFDEAYKNGFEDVDFCLKVKEKGYKIIYNPSSVLYHFESKTPGRKDKERENSKLLLKRWRDKIVPDEDKITKEDGLRIVYDKRGYFNIVYDLEFIRKLKKEGKYDMAIKALEGTQKMFDANPYIPENERVIVLKELGDCYIHEKRFEDAKRILSGLKGEDAIKLRGYIKNVLEGISI